MYECTYNRGTAFMQMKTGWIQASRLACDPTRLLLSQSFPIKKQAEFKGFKKQMTIKSIFRKLPSIQRVKVLLPMSGFIFYTIAFII